MIQPAARSIAFDLHGTDLADHASLTRFVVAHTIAPARAWWGLRAPTPGEGRDFLIERVERDANGTDVYFMRASALEESSRAFDPLVRALFLFARLFPGCVGSAGSAAEVVRHPGMAVLSDSMHLTNRSYDAIADLVAGLLGVPSVTPFQPGDYHTKARNDDALSELADARRMVGSVLSNDTLDEHTQFVDIGLRRLDFSVASEFDEILRRDVHRRLIWFTTFEVFDGDGDGDIDILSSTEWFERGVFAAQVPETLKGLVALDYTEQLRYDRAVGKCAHCGGLFGVAGRQQMRVARNEPVYHEDCYPQHKRAYYRERMRTRRRGLSRTVA